MAPYTGGSIATGRVSEAGQVKGDDTDKERYPGPPGWGLSVGLTALPHKKPICYGYFTTASVIDKQGRHIIIHATSALWRINLMLALNCILLKGGTLKCVESLCFHFFSERILRLILVKDDTGALHVV